MSETLSDKQAAVAEALHRAYPLSGGDYVSRSEHGSAISHLETKITNSELRQRNWVLAGILAVVLTFGGGYMSMMSKLDRLGDTLVILEGRRLWMARQDVRNSQQDDVLLRLSPGYKPMSYMEPPR